MVILGEGLEKKNFNNLIYELQLRAEVSLLGFVDNPYAYMAHSTVFVLSSAWQGFSNVIYSSTGYLLTVNCSLLTAHCSLLTD
ncbi:MAG: glycosyltransferase [Rivularia sp. (in: Bacteria)]|nr:glycosyltransferase [Rivularia sp. MS3]